MPIVSERESRDGIQCLRLNGKATLEEAMDFVARAIEECRDSGLDRLLVNACGLVGLPQPTLVDRFRVAEEWAREAQGIVAVALVMPVEYVHPAKFGVAVATKHGMQAEVCSTEAEAFAWLDEIALPPG